MRRISALGVIIILLFFVGTGNIKKEEITIKHLAGFTILVTAVLVVVGCSNNNVADVLSTGGDEESNVQLGLNEVYDQVRAGARLILAYDAQSNSFKGTVENTTNQTLTRVRVEVHLSNGVELGPTTPVDLRPGSKIRVELKASGGNFDKWTAHPEVGSGGEEEAAN